MQIHLILKIMYKLNLILIRLVVDIAAQFLFPIRIV